MWMQAQTAVNDMFEIKINESECLLSQREESPNESDQTDAKTKHFKQRQLVLSYMNRRKAFKDILFKQKWNKECDRKKHSGIIFYDKVSPDWPYWLNQCENIYNHIFKEFRKHKQ